jgi:hypothetical protein
VHMGAWGVCVGGGGVAGAAIQREHLAMGNLGEGWLAAVQQLCPHSAKAEHCQDTVPTNRVGS